MSLIPTILLFFVALQFVSTSMDYWFNANVENSLQESLELAQTQLRITEERAGQLSDEIRSLIENRTDEVDELESILNFQARYGADSLILYSENGKYDISAVGQKLEGIKLPNVPVNLVRGLANDNPSENIIQETPQGDLVRNVALTFIGKERIKATLITTFLVDKQQRAKMQNVTQGIEDYRQLKYLKEP